jgi:phage gp37-like protein
MPVDIQTIEDTVITALKAGMPYLRYCDSYSGQLDEQSILMFVKNFPAVLVYLERSKYTNRGYPLKWRHIEFAIFVADKNSRGNKAARHGDLNNPGTYHMLNDVLGVLQDKNLGLTGIDPFDVDREDAVINSSKLALYGAIYKTKYST